MTKNIDVDTLCYNIEKLKVEINQFLSEGDTDNLFLNQFLNLTLEQILRENTYKPMLEAMDSPTTPEIKTLPRGSKRRYGSAPEPGYNPTEDMMAEDIGPEQEGE